MRVVHVYKDIYPVKGGIENYVLALCERLRDSHEVDAHILVTSTGPRTERLVLQGVPTIKAARLASAASTPLSPMLAPLLRELQPDIVHLHEPYPAGELAYLTAGRGVPMVMTYHSDVVRQKWLMRAYSPAMELVLRRAAIIMCTSPQYKATSPWLRRHRGRTRIVPLGIDQRPFREPNEAVTRRAADLRARFGPHILHSHGVFRYYKGLRYLIEALQALPRVRLILTGTGPEERALREQVAAAGLQDCVYFAGAVADEDVPAYFHAADIYVLPAVARSEAFGLSMVEAQASGLPSISTEVGTGTSYVNLDGVTGLVVPPANPAAIANAVNQLLADEALRRTMGNRARRRAAELFDIDVNAAAVAAVYREALRHH